MTLNEYANARKNVVLFWTSVGRPTGAYTPLGHPDYDFADRGNLLALTGTLDGAGDWRWAGKGEPIDDRANTILQLHAYPDARRWQALVSEE